MISSRPTVRIVAGGGFNFDLVTSPTPSAATKASGE